MDSDGTKKTLGLTHLSLVGATSRANKGINDRIFPCHGRWSLLKQRTFMIELPDVIREERNVCVERSA